MRVLLTGAAGFVGSHMLEQIRFKHSDWTVVCPMTLRHHGNTDRLILFAADPKVEFIFADLSWGIPDTVAKQIGNIDIIFNIASNSGVEESISDPSTFVRNNVELMLNMLNLARDVKPRLFLQMGTDEEYGPAPEGVAHREWVDPLIPSNPYSASKAAQAALGIAYWRTYGVPIVLTRTMNLIGPGQSREKLVPTVIRRVLDGELVQIYAEGDVPGSRCWIDVRDFCDAWLFLVDKEIPMWPDASRPALWHIVGREMTNLALAELIADTMHLPLKAELIDTYAVRPGHDLRYALDGTLLKKAGWVPRTSIDVTVAETVNWYLQHAEWL